MGEFLISLVPWGTEVIVWVQSLRSDFLDAFFASITLLGEEEFYLLYLPLIYWCISKRLGVGLVYLSLLSTYLNFVIKDLFGIPRPADPRIAVLRTESNPSFPSNHAQGTMVNLGYPASQARRWGIWTAVAILISLVSLSRVYLGVHYPQDVVGGLALGLFLLATFGCGVGGVSEARLELPFTAWLSLAVIGPLLLLVVHPTGDTAKITGALLGMGSGIVLEKELVGFSTDGSWWKRLLRLIFGLLVTGGPYVLFRAVFPPGLLFRVVRYGLLGWVASFLAPWLFVRIALAEGGKG